MNEVVRVGLTPRANCPCVIVVRVTPVVLRNRHVTIGVYCLDVSNVPICKPRDIADPGSFVVWRTGLISRIDPVARAFPSDMLVAGGKRYSPLVQLVSDIARTFAFPLVPCVQDPLASIRNGAYTSVIVSVDCQAIGDAHRKAECPQTYDFGARSASGGLSFQCVHRRRRSGRFFHKYRHSIIATRDRMVGFATVFFDNFDNLPEQSPYRSLDEGFNQRRLPNGCILLPLQCPARAAVQAADGISIAR